MLANIDPLPAPAYHDNKHVIYKPPVCACQGRNPAASLVNKLAFGA